LGARKIEAKAAHRCEDKTETIPCWGH